MVGLETTAITKMALCQAMSGLIPTEVSLTLAHDYFRPPFLRQILRSLCIYKDSVWYLNQPQENYVWLYSQVISYCRTGTEYGSGLTTRNKPGRVAYRAVGIQ